MLLRADPPPFVQNIFFFLPSAKSDRLLGPLFKRRGGDPGDSLRIEFDLKTKIAVAELGQASVDENEEDDQQLVK
jgi:hypothetical protein